MEKPDPAKAPSRLCIIGRYILQPEIFAELDRQEQGAGDEIQLTDSMAQTDRHACRFTLCAQVARATIAATRWASCTPISPSGCNGPISAPALQAILKSVKI